MVSMHSIRLTIGKGSNSSFLNFKPRVLVFTLLVIGKANSKLLVQGGLRADYGKNITEYSKRYVYSSTNTVADSLESPETNDDYFNVSGSLGVNRKLGKKGELRTNIGKSFPSSIPERNIKQWCPSWNVQA